MARTTAKPRRKPVQERSRVTVEAILEAAAQVFEGHGYAAGTTNRIAERAGVSIGTLYQYFPDKDAILAELTLAHLREGARELGRVVAWLAEEFPPVREGLEEIVGAMLELHRERPGLHRVLFEETPRLPELEERIGELVEAGRGAIAGWLKGSSEACVRDPDLAAELIVQVVESVTHGLVIHPRPGRSAETYGAEAVTMLDAYLMGQ